MRRYYTTFEAARVLGVSLPTVVNWIEARRIRAHRTPGGHRRIDRVNLAAFMRLQGMPLPEELADLAEERRKALVVGEAGPGREGAARRLAAAGFAIDQASPGFAAGAAAVRFAPQVVVLLADGPDGGETLRGLRLDRDLSATPVVAVGRADWREALVAAGSAVAVAPADGDLDAIVRKALAEPPGRRRPARRRGRSRRPAD
jgi:excisionase family DNA binding protein